MALAQALAVAFGFLTRLPLRAAGAEPRDLGRSVAFFPVVGLALGAILAAAVVMAGRHLTPAVAGAGLAALLAWLTGGLHLDGLADVFDGLSGGHGDRGRILAIMRDARIGAHGAAALVLVLLLKAAALAPLAARGDLWALAAFPAVARFAAAALVAFLPYARPEGLGRAFHDHARPDHVIAAAVLTAPALVGMGAAALLPTAVALACAGLLALTIQRRIGGLTGDAYGACIEVAEVAFVVVAGAVV